jgi:hypothetical protein
VISFFYQKYTGGLYNITMIKLTQKTQINLTNENSAPPNNNISINDYYDNLYTALYPQTILSTDIEFNDDINTNIIENYKSSILSIPISDTTSIYNLSNNIQYIYLNSNVNVKLIINSTNIIYSNMFLYNNKFKPISLAVSNDDSNNYPPSVVKADIRYVLIEKY